MNDPRQLDLFSPTPAEALAARDLALAAVEANAEEACPGFGRRAREFILGHLLLHGPTPAEDLTDAMLAAGIVPHDRRAVGPVLLALARAGAIAKVGACRRRRGHGTSGGNVWDLAIGPGD